MYFFFKYFFKNMQNWYFSSRKNFLYLYLDQSINLYLVISLIENWFQFSGSNDIPILQQTIKKRITYIVLAKLLYSDQWLF